MIAVGNRLGIRIGLVLDRIAARLLLLRLRALLFILRLGLARRAHGFSPAIDDPNLDAVQRERM